MADTDEEVYGVTKEGFNIKRMDTILDEVQSDINDGWSSLIGHTVDIRQNPQSYINVLAMTFSGMIAECWEALQEVYYSKYPASAEGISLDNSVQYMGIMRGKNKPSYYPIYCTGEDGTVVHEGSTIGTSTRPQVVLANPNEYTISRESCNSLKIAVSALYAGDYSITIDGTKYAYTYASGTAESILTALQGLMPADVTATLDTTGTEPVLFIKSTTSGYSMVVALTSNLKTTEVTTIASYATQDYGKIVLAEGTVTEIITSVTGLNSITNYLAPVYGQTEETDEELRQSYLEKISSQSSGMVSSICDYILNNVDGAESAIGYENDYDAADSEGRPPHSIEIIVEGGDGQAIGEAIFKKKAAGIQTYGSQTVKLQLYDNGTFIPVHFNRPDYIYVWIKATLYGAEAKAPTNYADLTKEAIVAFCSGFKAGDDFISQQCDDTIYAKVSGISYVKMEIATETSSSATPSDAGYKAVNVITSLRQKALISAARISVAFKEGDYE